MKTVIRLVAIFLLSGFVLASAVLAQNKEKIDITQLKHLPTGESITQDIFIKNTRLFEAKPLNDERLAYQVRLPRNWESRYQEQIQHDVTNLNINTLTTLSRYFGPPMGEFRPFLDVRAIELKEETFAEDWIRHYLMINSLTLQAMKVESHRQVSLLYTFSEEGGATYASRALISITDNILLFSRFAVPIDYFNQSYAVQARVMNSFKFLKPLSGSVEQRRRFSLLDTISFYYPNSWVVRRPDFRSSDKLSVQLHRLKEGDIIFGNIRIYAVKKMKDKNISQEIKNFVKSLKEEGWTLKSLMEKKTFNFPTPFKTGFIEVYDIKYNEDILDQELWFTYTESAEHYFFFHMLTPKREIARHDWAANKAVFNLLLGSIRLADFE